MRFDRHGVALILKEKVSNIDNIQMWSDVHTVIDQYGYTMTLRPAIIDAPAGVRRS